MHERVATGAAIMIQLNEEDTDKQTAFWWAGLLSQGWRSDSNVGERKRFHHGNGKYWVGGCTCDVAIWIFPSFSSVLKEKVAGQDSWAHKLQFRHSSEMVVQFLTVSDSLVLQTPWGGIVWLALFKINRATECRTRSETSSLCCFWSLATECVLPKMWFLMCIVLVCGGKQCTQGLSRVLCWLLPLPTTL